MPNKHGNQGAAVNILQYLTVVGNVFKIQAKIKTHLYFVITAAFCIHFFLKNIALFGFCLLLPFAGIIFWEKIAS